MISSKGDGIYFEKIHKRIIAAISIVPGAGGIVLLIRKIDKLKNFINNLDESTQIIVVGMILLFTLLTLVFFVKPIALTLIRWIIFKKIHKEEVSNTPAKNNKLAQKKIDSLSESLFSELDEVDKESKEDFEKIEKIVDYQEKRKSE